MLETVTLVTDRPAFVPQWRDLLEKKGFAVRVQPPEEIGRLDLRASAVVFDAAAEALDDDELLTSVAFVRAQGAVAIVDAPTGCDDMVDEICRGMVVRGAHDFDRIVTALRRRMDPDRGKRFEFLTVAPNELDLLCILGDGHSATMARPISSEDDESEVVGITLSDDATSAVLELDSGVRLEVQSSMFAPSLATIAADMPIDGARLGARLRELRLEAGLTQAELARRTGIHRPNIARVEAGRHTPSLETLARLATAIGVPTTRVLAID